nr:family 20 glycosylhydrolase [Pedobacter sp. ASV19]
MKHFLITVLLLNTFLMSFAQMEKQLNPADVQLKWELLSNTYKKTGLALSSLTLINEGKQSLPASGWSIYFNSGRLVVADTDTAAVQIQQVNGDLFRLIPKSGNLSLAAGCSKKIQLLAEEAKNRSDFPSGFYLVWDHHPEKGYSFKKFTATSLINRDHEEAQLAAKIYRQNQLIKPLTDEQIPAIFPSPVLYQPQTGTFDLNAQVKLSADADFHQEAQLFAEELSRLFRKTIPLNQTTAGPAIVFKKENGLGAEAYKLSISPQQILIRASDPAGAFYAIQSLKTMLPPGLWSGHLKSAKVPSAEVQDAPRFKFRGFMLEVARNFQSKAEVLKILDAMALYKLNVLHFHLNDDEGWRLEIPGLPELTEVGSQRGHTVDDKKNILPSYGSGPITGANSGSGFYTKADFIEILKYAALRHIRVIPEIETPGHARAAIKSMDARYDKLMKLGQQTEAEEYLLRDRNDQSVYRSVQGWNDNVLNPALPSVYRFMEKVVDEIGSMYKEAGLNLNTVHFGGDEVPAGVWGRSPAVAELIKQDSAIKGPDDLWYYYFTKVNALLKARGLYLTGWEEIGLRKTQLDGQHKMILNSTFVNDNFHTEVWNNVDGNEDLPYKMANAGYKVTLTCVTHLYFDLAANTDFEEPGQYWGGYVDTDKPFYFIPYDYYKSSKEDVNGHPVNPAIFAAKERLTDFGKTNIIGIQAPLWSETIKSPERLEYMLLPKLLGLAERAWAKDPSWATEKDTLKSKLLYQEAWSAFVHVLGKRELPRLSAYNGGYLYRIPTPGVLTEDGYAMANTSYPGLLIRYTTNGTEPSVSSPVYQQPVPLKGVLKFALFNALGRQGRSVAVK